MNSIELFSGKSTAYANSRPNYPNGYLKDLALLNPSTVLDVGSGSGILTKQLLDFFIGDFIYALEPNGDMRMEFAKIIGDNPKVKHLNGVAESIPLPNASVDLITVAQAFHYFDVDRFRKESKRILKPDGTISLVWNMRNLDSPLHQEIVLAVRKYNPDFDGFVSTPEIQEQRVTEFFVNGYEKKSYENSVVMEKEQFILRNLSSSYAPSITDPAYEEFQKDCSMIFELYQKEGKVLFETTTENYMGKI